MSNPSEHLSSDVLDLTPVAGPVKGVIWPIWPVRAVTPEPVHRRHTPLIWPYGPKGPPIR